MHLEKALLKMTSSEAAHQKLSVSEETAPEATSSEASHQKLLHQRLKSVDKVQCTKCTSTNSAPASATTISASCLHVKTRITVMFAVFVSTQLEWI